jgi:hypothetical protein
MARLRCFPMGINLWSFANVCFWHETDIPARSPDVRFEGKAEVAF